MEQHFLKFPKKKTTFARYTQIFENFYPEVFFPFNFAPGISRIFFDAVSKFSKVLVEYMESATGVLTICMEKPVILRRTQMEWFILADEKFQYHLYTTTSARLIPEDCNVQDGQFRWWNIAGPKPLFYDVTAVLFLLPLLTNFLQLICTCSTLDEKDVRFWSLVICVSFFHSWFLLLSLMTQEITCIWNFSSNDNFEFVPCFLVRKSAVPFVQKCTIKSIQMVGTPLWLVILFSQMCDITLENCFSDSFFSFKCTVPKIGKTTKGSNSTENFTRCILY